MFDIKPTILTLLETIPGVTITDDYPKDFSKMPHISFYEIGNSDPLGIANSPLSDISIQIDIWHNRSTGSIAEAVNEKLNSIGFRRNFQRDITDPNIKHKTMRYRGVIDTRSLRVSQ